KTFIEAGNIGMQGAKFTEAGVMWQTIIHITFILSAVGIAYVDKLGHSGGPRPAKADAKAH
ncbi:MAG TPA: TIGR00645 family protein, partial [Hyphomicrobiaceae bacterium]|nr:TIGR00645 family protein [Hyphomicrobiaceae bacterium]